MTEFPDHQDPPGEDQPGEDQPLEGSGYAFRRFNRETEPEPAPSQAPEESPATGSEDVLEALAKPAVPAQERAALSITFQSWSTPVVGLVMLLVGILGGYFVRPYIAPETGSTPQTDTGQPSSAATQPQGSPEDRAALMDALIPNVRHFRGDADAPVTFIEFSDFQ